jgi:Ca2+/Na+ antiporter
MYCSMVEFVGEGLFYLAVAVGVAAAVLWLVGLIRGVIVAIRSRRVDRPMWVNYAALVTGLAVPVMVLGLVLWGRLDWWSLLLFVPLLAGRFVLFRMGSSISRRSDSPPRDETPG